MTLFSPFTYGMCEFVSKKLIKIQTVWTFIIVISIPDEKKEEIWLFPMTKAPTPTKKSKMQRDNTKNATKTSITQRLRTDLGRSVGVTIATNNNFPRRPLGVPLRPLVFEPLTSYLLQCFIYLRSQKGGGYNMVCLLLLSRSVFYITVSHRMLWHSIG